MFNFKSKSLNLFQIQWKVKVAERPIQQREELRYGLKEDFSMSCEKTGWVKMEKGLGGAVINGNTDVLLLLKP